ncbi:MAG TPA: ABC-type transport auxiliary lipoprotein family protein [Steroidobacteraceae bacterium]|nr:ABC-type transport auxiliary lipoprotein family protein [Steroidobacteraceae bacterium]
MKVSRWIAAALAALVSGCGSSPPLRYYALQVVTPATRSTALLSAMLIHVRHVSLPPEMDHRGLTHHQGPTRLEISDTDEWSAPLSTLIQATVTRDLGERLGYDHVLAPEVQPVAPHPDPEQRGTRASSQANLDLDFVNLAADDGCGISAQVNWTLSVPNGAARRGTTVLMAPASGCPAGLAAALSTALGDLADQLARQLTTS